LKVSFSNFTGRLLGYFLRGVLFVSPVLITVYAIYAVVTFLDSLIPGLYPGLSVAAIMVGITLIGFYSYSWVFQSFLGVVERVIFRAPGLKFIYTTIKDLTVGLAGNKKSFSRPVLVLVNKDNGLHKLGFITNQDLSSVDIRDLVSVYFPHSYNFSGELYLVPRASVTLLKSFPPSEAMKFIVSGGITVPGNDPRTHRKK
jgi:uncharacterized membrane protein